MALRALRKISRGRKGKPRPFVAPIGGLNRRDALASMAEQDAYAMDNWFPATDAVETRKGYTAHVSALGAAVETLLPYVGVTKKLLAFANTKCYDVTAGPAVDLTGVIPITNAQWVHTMFTNAAQFWALMVNGTDAPMSFDGTTLTALVITGVTGGQSTLAHVFSFKGRNYFAARDQAGFYYLPVGNIQGAASYFDLGQIASQGGTLQAICSITKDGGDGPDDFIVFVMSTGEAIVYQGFDPSNALNWALVGRFFIAPPIGRKCTLKYGGDTLLITELGLVSLLSVFDGKVFNPDEDTVSYKLGSALTAFIPNKGTFGWQCVLHPISNMLVFNVPVGATEGFYYQYVMNTRTNAWCRFTDWNGICWAEHNGGLYFGTYDGNVRHADNGYDDNGEQIRCNVKQAYSYFDENGVKKWGLVKLILSSTGSPAISVGMGVDFKDDEPNYDTAPIVGSASLWDLATWDVDPWGADEGVNYFTQDLNKLGFAGSVNVKCAVRGDQVRWYASQHVFELGGLIGDTR